ncbi:hypothetical protein OAA64_01245 [bacterium]|jgi:hypothetical protein|nr:hypothetical protein [bacterium]
MAKQSLEEFIGQATKNVNDDRAATKTLLMAIMKYMQTGDDRHREVGLIAAKYLETLQRSNEQLVKLAGLIQKKERGTEAISDEDKQELFDLINQKEEED